MDVTLEGELRCQPVPRLAGYVLAAVAGLTAAVLLGEPELLMVAAPFATLALAGTADRRPPVERVTVSLAATRVVEGDVVNGSVILHCEGLAAHVVLLSPGPGLLPAATGAGVAAGRHVRGPAASTPLPLALRAPVWGRHRLGDLHVRSRRPWSLLVWDLVVPLPGDLQVLPQASQLRRLLPPAEPRGGSGPHVALARGHGTELAELRPYQPGDRLRDVSWAATARTGQPWVSEHHPERTGSVVLLVDGLGDGGGPTSPSFAPIARAAWTLASAHLRVGDAVGVLTIGSSVRWFPPSAGRRARVRLLSELLDLTQRAAGETSMRRPLLPPGAVLVGLTMLQSERFVTALAGYRRRGHRVVAVALDPTATLPATVDPVERAARRLWRADLDVQRAALARAGVPAVVAASSRELTGAVAALQRTLSRPASRAG